MSRMRLVMMLVLALVATAAGAAAKEVEVAVGLDDHVNGAAYLRYTPSTVVVQEGDTVTWRTNSDTPHTVSAALASGGAPPEAFESSPAFQLTPDVAQQWFGPGGFLMPAKSFRHSFNETGTFVYVCKIHPGMTGTVTVVNGTEGASQGSPLPIGGSSGANRTQAPGFVHVAAGWGSGDVTVDRFAPDNLTVPVGTVVVWTNLHSAEPHTVTGFAPGQAPPAGGPPTAPPAFDSSPNIRGEPAGFSGPGAVMMRNGGTQSFSHTFATPGVHTYTCRLHPGQWGTVVVLAKEAPANQSSGPSRTGAAGSSVPGLEVPLVLGGLGLLALAARRRS